MKFINIIHGIGAIASIFGIWALGSQGHGFFIIIWPFITLTWVMHSFVNAVNARYYSKWVEDLLEEKSFLIDSLTEIEERIKYKDMS